MKWDAEKIAQLREYHENGLAVKDIADKFNVTVNSIKAVLYRKDKTKSLRRRSSYVQWNNNLEQKVKDMLKNAYTLSDIASHLNISYSSLTSKMRRMDVKFYTPSTHGKFSPKEILNAFNITESQLRQHLNNRSIRCETRGKNLVVTENDIENWLSDGYACLYTPRENEGKWMEMWKRAFRKSRAKITCMAEISEVFNVSNMSVTYYVKKKGFPKEFTYMQSYNIYDREAVNKWAVENNKTPLSPMIDLKYLHFANGYALQLYNEIQSKNNLTT